MSPHKQPSSLFKICIKSCVTLISSACCIIEKNHPEYQFEDFESEALSLKHYLMSMLPARLFDVLCSERTCFQYRGDPRIQLLVLTHPNMTVFRKCDLDNGIPQCFWIKLMADLAHLVVLDLKFICTDEILQVICTNCPLLEEINIVSRVDVCKSLVNASVLTRSISDSGLSLVGNLKQLRILAMDSPRNERANRVGRCVSQAGIINLLKKLPYLEELRIESCDIASTLVRSPTDVGPLSLRKINYHFASADGIRKLSKICPFLRDLSVTHLSEFNKDAILEEITVSDLRLHKLTLSFFSFTDSMERLLLNKGCFLTHFSLWEAEQHLTFDTLLLIGKCCPNLISFCVITQSHLVIPRYFVYPKDIFTNLQDLSIGNENFDLHQILTFFLGCTDNLQKLIIKYQTRVNFDETLLFLVEKGRLQNINFLWFDCTIEISKQIVMYIIQKCEKLKKFTVELMDDYMDVLKLINENNYDLELGGY